ncbi:sickle tail protein isoform X2 [Gymnodraco acuticeps]|uniref:Sickle tail protein isoform X2 n=1 Tax=Gymnodraco acuticeps TaxID=8218 RepID=A0A6P8TEF4_GYMAC|nr:sickle tail protein isoform X2 [Gymnodraco acuticeps]
MSDRAVMPPMAPFTRGCKERASLPVGWLRGQTRERLPGVMYLQYGEQTQQVKLPVELNGEDALRALFVSAFPQQLTMKMLQSPNMAIYIKDTSRNVYYDLEDIRNITSHSCLKVYHKDPAHVFNRHARPEGKISKEALYGSHSPVHTLSASSRNPLHSLQGSMSPPMVRSMPSSPSRRPYGGSTGSRTGMVDPGSSMLPGGGRSSSLSSSSSAILERRDVKPDEDVGSSKALVVRGEGGPHFPDSYCSSLQDGGGGGRFSSSQCSAPPSLPADMVDAGIPGGLQQYRASVKPLLMGHGDSLQTCSLHRQKSRKFGDSQLPSLGTKTPPPSPHRVNEVRMIGRQIIGGVSLVALSPERMSPIRRSLRQDSNGAEVEIVNRSRGSGSSSSTSSVFLDSPLGQPERLLHGHVTNSNPQSERMKAMEEQIASLAGLVHSALSMGSDVPAVKALSENAECKHLKNGAGASPEVPVAVIESVCPAPPSDSGLQQSLVLAKRHVCDLRLQLNQLRHLQLSNQESLRSMLRMAGEELVVLMCDGLVQSEEAANRRLEMERERIHYLTAEERTLKQLQELEDYVERLQRSSAPSTEQLSLTLREVEDGAVNLWRVGEALALLKGEFPELQGKLRSVLRLEVEAVRFLKEEPHKMESMLKRVRALTEALSCLRRCVSESTPPATAAQVETLNVPGTDQGPVKTQSPQSSPKPQPRSSVRPAPLTPSLPGGPAEASPVMARRMNASTSVNQPPHHQPSLPLTPTHGRDSPSIAKVSPRSRESSPALQRMPLQPPTQGGHTDQTAERRTLEGSLSVQILPPATNTHCNQDLQEAQASLMQSVPAPYSTEGCSASGQRDSTASAEQQEVIPPQLRECVGSTQLDARDSAPSASQLVAVAMKPPPSAPPSASPKTEHSGRPQVEKPRRTSVDKAMKQSPDRGGKSPPPPPTRRFHAVSSGLTTGSSGEVIFTTRKDPGGAKDDSEKKPPVVLQPKPWRQPPEVKPKPTITIPKAPTHREEEEEDEKLMKELQVTKALSGIHLPGGNKQWNGEMSQVANQKPSMMAAYDYQSAPQTYSSRPLTRSCHTTSSSPPEKAHKGPKQPGQAVRERASQIPALSHSSGKHPPPPPCSDTPLSSSGKPSLLQSVRGLLPRPSPPLPLHQALPLAPPLPPPHESLILSLNLSRLLPSSSHFFLPSHPDIPPAQGPPLAFTSTSPHSYYFSSSYSSSSPSSSTSSSLSPTSSSLSPTSSLLPPPGPRSIQMSASSLHSPGGRGRKRSGGQQVLRPGEGSKDAA